MASVAPKFPDDVGAAVARDAMRRLETDTFIIYYPAARRDEAMRFAARAEGCAAIERGHAHLRNHFFRSKPVVVVPDVPFNNAYVVPPTLGEPDHAVVPLQFTFDFATEFGIPPDPGYIGCHELTHYTHEMQIAGLWGAVDRVLGDVASPQAGLDSWFWEGLATHYEAALQPHAGRPGWPIFTGMFAAAYAGHRVGGGDFSEYNRLPPPGGNYLLGTMFVDFLARRYGDDALWRVIEDQASSWTIILAVSSRFADIYGKSLSSLIDDFADEVAQRYPVRRAPDGERRVRDGGDDARYARGLDGSEAIIASDVDRTAHLDVFAPDGGRRASIDLVDVLPPRTLVIGDPILTSGLSITHGGDVWFTAIDQGATYQVTRLLRWSGGGSLEEVATDLGPGACISPDGGTYYYMQVDGDRWSLAAYDVGSGAKRIVRAMPAGQYVLAAQPSPDGRTLIASVWDGRFSQWIIDAATGTTTREIHGADDAPVYDGSFVDATHVVYLGEIDGRFQAVVEDVSTGATQVATDAPYAVLNARASGGNLRFLSREGWAWNVDEVALAAPVAAPTTTVVVPESTAPAPPARADAHVVSDEPYHLYDHLFAPTLHTVAFYTPVSGVTMIGAGLTGSDRLGQNRWAIAGYLETDTREPAVQAAYLNAQLAPWLFVVNGDLIHWTETDQDSAGNDVRVHRQERDLIASFGRTWRGSWSAFARGLASELHDRAQGYQPIDQRLVGPGLSLAYSGFDATPYAGVNRGGALALDGAWYPSAPAQPSVAIEDLRAELDLAAPVPGTKLHTLHASAIARDLVSSTSGLLELGGLASLPALYQGSTNKSPPDFTGPDLPPLVRFDEVLRGYEDFPITTDRAAIANLSWRWPLIVDRGWATSLYVLPASFVRELDVELFADGAIDETMGVRSQHAAAGAAITLRAIVLRVPLLVTYQAAKRLRDDDAWTQFVGVGPGF